jgi:hypothetical protein
MTDLILLEAGWPESIGHWEEEPPHAKENIVVDGGDELASRRNLCHCSLQGNIPTLAMMVERVCGLCSRLW